MTKSVQVKAIDYPFLMTIGGIGGLVALAGLIFGIALGQMAVGFGLATVSLIVAAFVIGASLYQGNTRTAPLPDDVIYHHKTTPHVITSRDGALVYCNDAYRNFLRNDLNCDVLPPFALLDNAQCNSLNDLFARLELDGEENRTIHLMSTEGSQRYGDVAFTRNSDQEGYINWTFSGVSTASPMPQNHGGQGDFTLDQMGQFLDRGDCGLLSLSTEGQITYVNDAMRHWLEGASENEISLPCEFSSFCVLDPAQLRGEVTLKTPANDDTTLEFIPLETGAADSHIFQVFSCETEVSAIEASSENINIDRFFKESPIGIAIATEQGDVLERNSLFRDYIRQLEIKNFRNLKQIIDSGEYQEFYDKVNATLSTGQASSIADIGFKGKGEKHGHIYITRLNKFDDHERVVILYLIDTTEQKNLELQFAQSQKMQAVGQLAGGVAHDFNNLLTAIIGFSDLLLVRHGPGDQSFSDIIQIKQNANRAANLVRQLLAFSRQQTLRPKVLTITDVLAELSNLLGRLIGDGIELEMKHGRDLGQVKVDQGQMEQVIINLCVNARDAMENNGKISIRTRNISLDEAKTLSQRYQVMPPSEYVLLEVEDTGCGIAKEHLGKIFEPFFSTKEVGKGTGLGLSTVYGIVKQTGGFVFPNSEIGKGTVFSIYLPTHKENQKIEQPVEEAPEEPEKAVRDLTGKGTILLVEDEDAVRMFATRALKNKGYNVYEANSGEAGLELFGEIEGELDLLISDVVMPIMDGPTLVRKIRERNDKLKVIFISGYAEDAFEKTPGEEDFHFLPKPFSLKQLAEQVKEVLETN